MGAREQMYPQVMTAWKKHPEGRSASWENLGQVRCRWEAQRGAQRSASGDISTSSALILVPFGPCPHIDPCTMERIAQGTREVQEPPADALAVISVSAFTVGSSQVDHWELTAE